MEIEREGEGCPKVGLLLLHKRRIKILVFTDLLSSGDNAEKKEGERVGDWGGRENSCLV